MERGWKIFLIIVVIVLLDFLVSFFLVRSGGSTLMGCSCALCAFNEGLEEGVEDFTGDCECNSVKMYRGVFISGIFNVWLESSGREIIVCEEGKEVDSYDDYRERDFKFNFFGKSIG